MNKYLITTLMFSSGLFLSAQTEFDALNFSTNDIVGTARYVGMAGAFGALGGDPSAIHLNPAGLGVYRSFEASMGFGVGINNTSAKWDHNKTTETDTHVPFTNFGFVCAFTNDNKDKGIISNNFSVTFNKLRDFNRTLSATAYGQSSSMLDYIAEFTNLRGLSPETFRNMGSYDDKYDNSFLSSHAYNNFLINPNADSTQALSCLNPGETVSPTFLINENGYINEWAFSYGMNISNKFYWGLSLALQDLNYSSETMYAETLADGGGFFLRNYREVKGIGVNVGFGVIFRPVDMIRIGAAVHTPTFFTASEDDYGIDDYYHSDMYATINGKTSSSHTSGIDNYYELLTPWRYNFSAAVVLGHRGILSLDYQLVDYNTMSLKEDYGTSWSYDYENDEIDRKFQATHSLRAGLEFNVVDGLFVRCGYAFVTSPFSDPDKTVKQLPLNTTYTNPEFAVQNWTNYYSAGLGYRKGHWFADLAYQLKHDTSTLYAYDYSISGNNLKGIDVNTFLHTISLSAGFKF